MPVDRGKNGGKKICVRWRKWTLMMDFLSVRAKVCDENVSCVASGSSLSERNFRKRCVHRHQALAFACVCVCIYIYIYIHTL